MLFVMKIAAFLPGTYYLRRVDQGIQTRNIVHQHGNSCKTTAIK